MRFGCFGLVKDVEAVANAGFDFIELNLREVITLSDAEFRELCERMKAADLAADAISWILPAELDLTSEQTHYEQWRDYIAAGIARSTALGAKIWPIGSGRGRSIKPENGPVEAQQQRMKHFFAQLAAQVRPSGITVLMEPLGPDYSNHLLTLEECVCFVNDIKADNLRTMCDLRHLTSAGVPLSQIEVWQDYIGHAHIDLPVGTQRRFPRPGDGYDYREYFRILQKIGVKRLSVEALHEDSLCDGRESIAYMRQLLASTEKRGKRE